MFFLVRAPPPLELLLSTKVRPSRLKYSHRWEAVQLSQRFSQVATAACGQREVLQSIVRELCWKLSESSTEKADVVVRRPKTARLAQGERQNEWNGNF